MGHVIGYRAAATSVTALRLAGVGVAITLTLVGVVTSEYLEAQGTGQDRALCLSAPGVRTVRQLRANTLRFIGTDAGHPIPQPRPLDSSASPETAARSYLTSCGSLLGLTDQATELRTLSSTAAGEGRSVVRFQQLSNGVPIVAGELLVQLDARSNIVAVAGETLSKGLPDTRASVDAAAAIEVAIDVASKTHDVDRSSLTVTAPELWIYAPALISPFDDPPALVWRMEVSTAALSPIRELVLIDAARGSVALHFNQVETVRNRETYNGNHTTTLPGTLICNESNPSCAGGDTDAIAAHVYAGDTYDFYQTNHGRDSLDNAGLTLRSTVHYGPVGYQNAFWNGSQMAYGDGFSQADDVVGHELTHGVTNFSSNLLYYYQSGAINESLSDVFGEFIDQTNGHGTDTPAVKWALGEDIGGAGSGGIRNMQNPPLFGNPDKMTSALYYFSPGDNGGVHYNSGINNKAAYLMVDGGTFNGQTVAPLGIPKTAKIYYEAQVHLLTSGSDYADLQQALFQACTNLVGTSGITAGDCQQVWNATVAVEMHLQPTPGFNPDAPICQVGQTTATVFLDNLESGSGNFTFGATTGTSRWSVSGGFSHSGLLALSANDYPPARTDTFAAMTVGVVVPPNGYLHFAHAFGFEGPTFDGGVVEYSTNGGATWTDAGGLFDANGYRGTIDSTRDNPLAGRSAFVDVSHGYISSRLTLASLAGQTIRFRWRMGLDATVGNFGWEVDDVRIYSCGGPQLTSVTPGSGYQGQANLPVDIVGQTTNFVQGVSTASFGPGITVNSVTVTDPTHATANVTIDANATPGIRDVSVTTGSEIAFKASGFTVTKAALVRQVTPDRGPRGTSMGVAVSGQFTHFTQGVTTASLGADVQLLAVSVIDATHAIVFFSISSGAALGPRTLTMTTGQEVVALTNGFTVTATLEAVHSLGYVLGRRLSPSQGGTDGTQRVVVLDLTTNSTVTTIPVGQGCSCVGSDGLAVTPDGSTIYVANELGNTVTVIRTATNSVVGTIPVGNGPIAVAAHPNGQRVYVVNGSATTSVSVIDTASDSVVVTIPLGVIQARGIAVKPDGTRLYVTTYGSNNVKVIDTATNAVIGTIPVGANTIPMSADVTPNGATLYVANTGTVQGGSSISVIDTATNAVTTTVPAAFSPYGVRFTPDGARAYVASTSGSMPVISTATNAVIGSVPVGAYTVDFSQDGTRAYAATNYGGVQIVNTATLGVIGSIPLDSATIGLPLSMTMSPPLSRVLWLSGTLAFGEVHVGASKQGNLTILNTGNSTMTVNSIAYPPGFSGSTAPFTLVPGAFQNLPVTFSPTSATSYSGVITVNANQTSGAQTIPVSGSGSTDSTRDGDYDGDGKTELAIYRPSEGRWYLQRSGGGYSSPAAYTWGLSTDLPYPGDYDGDGKTDLAIFRPSTGHWFILLSGSNFTTYVVYQFGVATDIPVPGDYDGDDKTDIGVWRPSTGQWFVLTSTSGFSAYFAFTWGTNADTPVVADWDGDGKVDMAVYRAPGYWLVRTSTSGYTAGITIQWGAAGDIPVPSDYDGDKKTDPAVYRPSTGQWFVRTSTSSFTTGITVQWGASGDLPIVGDFDADGKADVSIFRPATGHWFILRSITGYTTFATYQWGMSTDIVLPRRP